jgi:hypothetical protein
MRKETGMKRARGSKASRRNRMTGRQEELGIFTLIEQRVDGRVIPGLNQTNARTDPPEVVYVPSDTRHYRWNGTTFGGGYRIRPFFPLDGSNF